jgi:ribosomal protein L40E
MRKIPSGQCPNELTLAAIPEGELPMPVCPRCGALNDDPAKTCRVCSAGLAGPAAVAAVAAPSLAQAAPLIARPAADARSGRFWTCALLFTAGIVGGVVLATNTGMKYDASGPAALDDQYTVNTDNGTPSSYRVTYRFTANGRAFTGIDTIGTEPSAADATVYYMAANPANNSLHPTTTNTTRMVETGAAFLVALVAIILLPKSYLTPIGVPAAAPGVGDSQAEPRGMKRGKYSAWAHVYIAFILQLAAVGFLLALGVSVVVRSPVEGSVALGVGFAVAAVTTLWVFSDRYRCIETFASRSCSGLMNLSLLYVPFVALVYANIRGLRKFSGR